ncbi:hypothetical protein TNCV_4984001 [Trichonephila clavipes]|nr:hypothetical protein TNCV_4984001 [Trichonephila clavipes]
MGKAPELTPPPLTTTPHYYEDVCTTTDLKSASFPLRGGSSVELGLELMKRWVRVCEVSRQNQHCRSARSSHRLSMLQSRETEVILTMLTVHTTATSRYHTSGYWAYSKHAHVLTNGP